MKFNHIVTIQLGSPETELLQKLLCIMEQNNHTQNEVLRTLHKMEERILMKQSEVKAIVAAAAGKTQEAFGEISTRLAALQQQIDDLIAGAGDPEVTDEAFLADLNTLKTNTDALADIVPNPEA